MSAVPHSFRPSRRQFLALAPATLAAAAVLGTSAPPAQAAEAGLQVYPVASVYPASTDYRLTVNGREIPITKGADYDIAQFAAGSGELRFTLTKINNTNIGAWSVSPRSAGISATVSGSSIQFTTNGPRYLIAKIDGRPQIVIAVDPLETGAPPASGTGIFNVTSAPYNVVPGNGNPRAAFQQALNDAAAWGSANGGQGVVHVPAGVYEMGNIYLRSNLHLYLAPGAVLRFNGRASDNDIHWHKDSINRDITWFVSTRYYTTNVKISGRGTIDGNAAGSLAIDNRAANLLAPIHTENFTVDGITFRESSSWAVIPSRSNDLLFRNLKIFNRFTNSAENDGIDVMESQRVLIDNAIGVSMDDPFSTKTWDTSTDLFRWVPGSPEVLEDVSFSNLVSWTTCYGIKVGQGVQTTQQRVAFRRVDVYDAAIGIGVHHKYGSAAASEVTVEDVRIERLGYDNDGLQTWLALFVQDGGRGVGPINGVHVSRVTLDTAGRDAARVRGLSGAAVTGVDLHTIRMPGGTVATSLSQARVTDVAYASGVTIAP